jgi:hypothetical protein
MHVLDSYEFKRSFEYNDSFKYRNYTERPSKGLGLNIRNGK